jgi:hypothetical protein
MTLLFGANDSMGIVLRWVTNRAGKTRLHTKVTGRRDFPPSPQIASTPLRLIQSFGVRM